jgi:hypothetical protein
MKTILVDAINGLILEDGTIFQEMYEMLETYPNPKLVLTGANDEQFEKFNLKSEDVIYFEHNVDAMKSAESIGIKSYFYDHTKANVAALKEFIDSASKDSNSLDDGPFYHGTKADLQTGDLLTAGFKSNYMPEITMNHIYFTALPGGAGLAAELASGTEQPRVYIVEPTGEFENDPNVTDKKFPGNPTRSYRSQEPLRVVGEVTDWVRLTPEQLQEWRSKLANIKGTIIN